MGLCYNCDEKFVRGHNKVCKRLFLLDSMVDDTKETPESSKPAAAEESPVFSLHAITCVRFNDTMQLNVSLSGTSFLALLNSGSTHNFMSESTAQCTGLPLQCHPRLTATVANSEHVSYVGVIHRAAITIHGDTFHADLFVMPLASFDMILGTQWLATLGPVLWDFGARRMTFHRNGQPVCWQGVQGPRRPPSAPPR